MNRKYSLSKFSTIIFKNIIVIVVFMVLGGITAGLYAKHKQTTTYSAKSNVIIGSNVNNINYKNSAVQAELNMSKTYEDLMENNRIISKAHSNLPKKIRKSVTVKEMSSDVDVDSHPNSLVLTVTGHADSANKAVQMANKVTETSVTEVPKLSPTPVKAKVVSKAHISDVTSKTHPSAKKYAVLGAALGILVGMVISFAITTWKHLA